MTATPDLTSAPTTHEKLLDWVREVAELTQPDDIYWCDGSDAEWNEMIDRLVASGTMTRLNDDVLKNSVYARTDPSDVARVE
ncbi:MAG: phosphoenolpyruvate carboxykinase, partial [Propionibacterium sp.]|nr:phosphoenolpyruvate carboxykinase [Propionibacterium sp.]